METSILSQSNYGNIFKNLSEKSQNKSKKVMKHVYFTFGLCKYNQVIVFTKNKIDFK